MDHLTDAELVSRLLVLDQCGGIISKASKLAGVGRAAFSESIGVAQARGLSAQSKVVDELGKAKAEVNRLKAEVRGLQRVAETEESIRQRIYGLASLPIEAPTWTVPRAKSARTPGVPMTIWSDWHWGENVNAAEVGGVNTFSHAVAQVRVRKLVETTIALAKDHMVRPVYPGIVVCLGGDMITGAIHEELAVTNWGTVQQQFIQVQEELIAALAHMADVFGRVFVPCVVGNHGRDTLKPRMKQRAFTSYEWNLYNQLARTFAKDKRFTFLIPDETDAYFRVLGHRFLLTHGDSLGVKGGDGIIGAIGPIARGTTKVGRAEAQIGRDFDTLLIGHYHTYIPRGDAMPVIANGSVIGYNEYARLGLRVPYSRPSQALWFVHQDHGITAQWQVYLDKKRRSEESSEWLTFQQRKAA